MTTGVSGLALDGATMIGAIGTLRTEIVPAGARLAVCGRSDGAPQLRLDGAAVPCAYPLPEPVAPERVSDGAGGRFAALLPPALLTLGTHQVSAECAGTTASFELTVVPFTAAPAHWGRLDDVRAGELAFLRADGHPVTVPAATPLRLEGWTRTGSAAPGRFLLRVGDVDVLAETTVDRMDVSRAHGIEPCCGFAVELPADLLARGHAQALLAIAQEGEWLITDQFDLQVGLPSDLRPVHFSVCGDRDGAFAAAPGNDVLFIGPAGLTGGYRSAAQPLVFRADSNVAPGETFAVEVKGASGAIATAP